MFKENVKKCRIEKKITQTKMAKLLNIPHQQISKWERGRIEPNIAQLIMLSKFFNITIDELVGNNIFDDFL